tara:strand:- start:687 stop:1475 length:789 start_codon:yes stop_codon:yes gene_type:complete
MDIDIGIITLKKHSELFEHMKLLFPNANIFLQPGVDVRTSSLKQLRDADIIGDHGYITLSDGRKSHFELNSKGGIGVFLANKLALLKDVTRPLLLFEDDCVIKNDVKFLQELDILLHHQSEYDVAVFGGLLINTPIRKECTTFFKNNDWNYIEGDFILMHSVLYSANGREKIGQYYLEHKLNMQIDGLISLLSKRNIVRLMIQSQNHTTGQKTHFSSIQNDLCILCYFKGGQQGDRIIIMVCLLICFLLYLAFRNHYKKCIN